MMETLIVKRYSLTGREKTLNVNLILHGIHE
jgi:hypothetical protein